MRRVDIDDVETRLSRPLRRRLRGKLGGMSEAFQPDLDFEAAQQAAEANGKSDAG